MYGKFGLFIGGEWVSGSATAPVFSPVAALKAGMVGINSDAMAASEAPFGGTNFSGIRREGGIEGIRDYLDVKSSQMVWA